MEGVAVLYGLESLHTGLHNGGQNQWNSSNTECLLAEDVKAVLDGVLAPCHSFPKACHNCFGQDLSHLYHIRPWKKCF